MMTYYLIQVSLDIHLITYSPNNLRPVLQVVWKPWLQVVLAMMEFTIE